MSKRLLFISQLFYPELFRGNDIAFDMAKRGVEVTVICGTPNYPKGKFFDGYGWLKRNVEMVNGVKVIRVPIIPRGQGSKLQLIANYFSYFPVASAYMLWHLLRNEKYDACFVQQLSPVMMSVPGVIFKKITGRGLYTWVLDLWPESLKAAGGINNKHVLNFFGWFAKLQYKNSDKILISSNGFKTNINSKGDFDSKIIHMPNWAEDEISNAELLPIPEFPSGFNVLFAGNIGEAQDFDNVIEAAKLLSDNDNVHFIIVGDGRKKEWVENQVNEFNLSEKIILLGRHDIKYMSSFFNKADCLFLALKDDEIFNLTLPAKMQAYMTAGKPIIAMLNGDGYDLLEEVGCGIGVPASSPERLVDAIRTLKSLSEDQRKQMGVKGRLYCKQNFNKNTILDNLYNLIFSQNQDDIFH